MGFFEKIKAGLTKTRQSLQNTLGGIFAGFHGIDDDFYDDLEESLILADLGVDTSVKAVEQMCIRDSCGQCGSKRRAHGQGRRGGLRRLFRQYSAEEYRGHSDFHGT